MDLGANVGSGHAGDKHHQQEHHTDMVESLRFQEEIQNLMRENLIDSSSSENNNSNNGGAGGGSSSFTALLGLPPNQAMELLHHEIVPVQQPPPPLPEQRLFDFPFRCYPTFPSNAGLVERAARYSVFAAEGSPETSAVPSNAANNSSPSVKAEPADSDSNPASSFPLDKPKRGGGKRREPEKSKAKSGGKKSKSNSGEDGEVNKNGGGGDKLPYVHVRARRGQATDSHSLAERARREKINTRMKLLQELVPGCSKITGTALVLDEIINHVQSLQRQVEFLSMRLAAVNPRIDFGGLDNFLSGENARLCGGNEEVVGMEASMWPELHVEGVRRQQPQQIWQVDLLPSHRSSSLWEKEDNHRQAQQHHGFISPGPSLLSYDSTNPVPLHSNQLKTEL